MPLRLTLLSALLLSVAAVAANASVAPAHRTSAGRKLLATPIVQSLPIVGAPGGLVAAKGPNAFDEHALGAGFTVPSDPSICAGNGYVVASTLESTEVYDTSFALLAPPRTNRSFFAPLLGGLTSFSLFDPRCYYDASVDRWFAIEAVYTDAPSQASYVVIASSQTSSPLGAWNEFRLTTTDAARPGCPCWIDHLQLGVNQDALFLTLHEFTFSGNPLTFGTQLYAVEKQALLTQQLPNRVHFDLGGVSTPDGPCNFMLGTDCWSSVTPAQAPDGAFEKGHGGTEYLLSSLDFTQTVDNRLELWAITNTGSISNQPALQLWKATVTSESYGAPPLAVQKDGPIPLGDATMSAPVVGPIQTSGNQGFGGDGMAQVSFAHGLVWGALTTAVDALDSQNAMEHHAGIAYFSVEPVWKQGLDGVVKDQGYIASGEEDLAFPALAPAKNGRAVVGYVLTGRDYYPSTAVSTIAGNNPPAEIAVADAGQSPNDDFCEYGACGYPRFGDYSSAIVVGHTVFFASQYVQYPNCSDSSYQVDPTCSGTRTQFTNWGTSLNSLPAK